MTEQRALLLKIFRSDECRGRHRSADEILEIAKRSMPGISRATVYNNLHSMESEGLIRRISGDFGCDYYDATSEPHAHLVCTQCHRISDLPTPYLLDDLKKLISDEIDTYELKIKYRCRSCRAQS